MIAIPPVPLTLGVTGHRNLVAAEVPEIEARLRELFEQLRRRFPDVPLRLLSPLAEGADRVAARIAQAAGIELVVALPFEVNEYERDFEHPESLREFRELLSIASSVEVIGGEPDRSRTECYARVGAYVSDHCQILIAVWDGKPGTRPGGTAEIVDYHQFGSLPGLELVRSADRLLAGDQTDLVAHVVCSRNCSNGSPADGLRPGRLRWLIAEPDRQVVDDIPVDRARMFARTGQFNRDCARWVPDPDPAGLLPGWSGEMNSQPDLVRTGMYFAAADQLANQFRSRYRRALKLLHVVAILMGVAFIAYADLGQHWTIIAYLFLFCAGLVLYQIANHHEWHRKFLDYRALAEGLRIQFYWRLAGVSGQLRNDFAYDNFLHKKDVEIGWIRNVMRFASAPRSSIEPVSSTASLNDVIGWWIGDSAGPGQLGYFEARCANHHRHVRNTRTLVAASLWGGFGLTVLLILFQRTIDPTLVNAMVAGMGLLPLIAAVREAYAHKVAESELLKQYRFMLGVYRQARFHLDHSTELVEKRRILRALGEAALDEHAEWLLTHRERPLEPGKL